MKISLSMSYQRKFAVAKIRDVVPILEIHVAKILLFPTSRDVNHWCNELISPLVQINRYTNVKGGVLSTSELWTLLFEEPLGSERQKRILINNTIDIVIEEQPTGTFDNLSKVYEKLVKLVLDEQPIKVERIRKCFV